MSSTPHEPIPSPYNLNKCHHTFLSELSTLTNPAFPTSIWDPVVDTQIGEDFVVPDMGHVFPFSDHIALSMGDQLPVLQQDFNNSYYSGGGLDELGFITSDYLMSVAENGPKANVMIQDYGSCHGASTYDRLPTLGKTNWEIQSGRNQQASTPNVRVGRYSAEERRDRIRRYLKKRNQRNFNKTIKYACRKTLADRRIRVRGRFAKNNEEVVDTKCNNNGALDETIISPSSYYDYADARFHQVKQDGEEWVQEAISSLMYNMAPYNYVPQWQPGLPLQ